MARFGAFEMTDQERADMWEEAERVFLGAVSTYDTDLTTSGGAGMETIAVQ